MEVTPEENFENSDSFAQRCFFGVAKFHLWDK